VPEPLLHCWCAVIAARTVLADRIDELAGDERGEGVISAAIAVLIMAALGVVMWVGFQEIWGDAKTNTQNEVTKIGS
jgi:hypothetical protein